jgi:hypothetical protein
MLALVSWLPFLRGHIQGWIGDERFEHAPGLHVPQALLEDHLVDLK